MVLNTLALLVTRPLLIPAMLAASGLYYGSSELTFSFMGTFIRFDTKKYPLAFLTAHCAGIGILLLRSRGKFHSSMKYHLTTIIAGGVASGVIRGIMKVKLSAKAAKNSNLRDNSNE